MVFHLGVYLIKYRTLHGCLEIKNISLLGLKNVSPLHLREMWYPYVAMFYNKNSFGVLKWCNRHDPCQKNQEISGLRRETMRKDKNRKSPWKPGGLAGLNLYVDIGA